MPDPDDSYRPWDRDPDGEFCPHCAFLWRDCGCNV